MCSTFEHVFVCLIRMCIHHILTTGLTTQYLRLDHVTFPKYINHTPILECLLEYKSMFYRDVFH